MTRAILGAALAVLAACSPASEPAQSNNEAQATVDYRQRLETMPEGQRNAVFIRAILDAGQECQHVESSEHAGTHRGFPVWNATCQGGGTWTIVTTSTDGFPATLRLEGPINRIRGTIEKAGTKPINLANARVVTETGRLEVSFDGEPLGYQGTVTLTGSVRDENFFGWMSLPNGTDPAYTGTQTEPFTGAARGTVAAKVPNIQLPFVRPAMEFGRAAPPAHQERVLRRGHSAACVVRHVRNSHRRR